MLVSFFKGRRVDGDVRIREVRVWGGKGDKLNRKKNFEKKNTGKKEKRLLTGLNPQANRDSNNESNALPTQLKEPTAKTQRFQRSLCLCRLLSKVI
jgi:hypothetical protein